MPSAYPFESNFYMEEAYLAFTGAAGLAKGAGFCTACGSGPLSFVAVLVVIVDTGASFSLPAAAELLLVVSFR